MTKIAFTTLGCKANWADTEALRQACASRGFYIVDFDDLADAYVVNTCAVTAVADQQSRQMLRKARRRNPEALIVAVGCSSEVDPEMFECIDAVFGTSDRNGVIDFLAERFEFEKAGGVLSLPLMRQSRSRAFLKIQDGCNRRCSYCIVPDARGASTSLSAGSVLAAAKELSKFHKEIIITGVDIGQYSDPDGRVKLAELLDRLTSDDSISRIRVSSIDPSQIDDEFISILKRNGRICRHIHLSIQSLSDEVIGEMGRKYTSRDVQDVVMKLVEGIPGIAVTGDLIAGFPGETEEDHGSTVECLRSLAVAGLHVFPFSARKGTRAFSMPGQVDVGTIKERAAELRAIARRHRISFLNGQMDLPLDVIVTSKEALDGEVVDAFSDNAISITLPAGKKVYGELAEAKIDNIEDMRALGSWC